MIIAILGAGGIGLGMAAILARRDHEVHLWAPGPAGIRPMLDGGPLTFDGVVSGQARVFAHLDIAEAVGRADIVIIAVPGYGHKGVIDRIVPLVRPSQHVAISSQMSLSALYLSRRLAQRGVDAAVSAWATTAITGRRTGPGSVNVSTVRKRVTASVVRPGSAGDPLDRLREAFGDIFLPAPDLLSVTLMNVNPATHLAMCLCNLTRMEYGETWSAYRGISPAVGRLIEAMDRERLDLAASFGLPVHTVHSHLHESFGLPLASVAEMAAEQHIRREGSPKGPSRLEHRFVVEDVPFGIVPLVAFGAIAGSAMPYHQAGLTLIGGLYGRDFVAENDILPELAIDTLDAEELLRHCGARLPVRDGVA